MDLQEISDRLEIADVITRYTRAIDTGEWDRLDTVFTPDAQIDYTESGGISAGFDQVKPWLAEMLPAFFPHRMHTIGQVEIVFDADSLAGDGTPGRAAVTAYFDNPMPMDDGAGGTKIVEIGGLYHHQMVRTDDGWRSRQLHEQVVWKRGL
ncbi:nuclear transport factor 2 family protein [Nocardioides sp. R-C-SC26]|uniref:nuclear transport factor 2 family protein n=1 Tax=Nocardioides sp. R-C-SC26 TaxID=2870414 RepID=UPI001E2838E7|nr:nuclear transport factor 2 family protein [Nocardioides sp. R-C-SC26]